MFTAKYGIEIELTGITRSRAAEAAAECLGGTPHDRGGFHGTKEITAADGRVWKFVSDGSIDCMRRENRQRVGADSAYSVELVSPILTYYEDIGIVQELVRRLRKAGGFTNPSCGIHIHLDGANHTARSIRNFVNIIAGRNDLFYKALQIAPERVRYCKKTDSFLVGKLNQKRSVTLRDIEEIWYEGYHESRNNHYHRSRYHFLNLHSFFTGNHTVELRGFNSELHAGKIRAYIVFALALNRQALTQKNASPRRVQDENEKFAMRTYLNRIGFIGPEFKNCREHLYRHLSGSAAWRFRDR
jgi:hypothetical protein